MSRNQGSPRTTVAQSLEQQNTSGSLDAKSPKHQLGVQAENGQNGAHSR